MIEEYKISWRVPNNIGYFISSNEEVIAEISINMQTFH